MEPIQLLPISTYTAQNTPQLPLSIDQPVIFQQVYSLAQNSVLTEFQHISKVQKSEKYLSFDDSVEPFSGQAYLQNNSYSSKELILNLSSPSNSLEVGETFLAQAKQYLPVYRHIHAVNHHQGATDVIERKEHTGTDFKTTSVGEQLLITSTRSNFITKNSQENTESNQTPINKNSHLLKENKEIKFSGNNFIKIEQEQNPVVKNIEIMNKEPNILINKTTIKNHFTENLAAILSEASSNHLQHSPEASEIGRLAHATPLKLNADTTLQSIHQKMIPGSFREVVLPQTSIPQRLGTELIQMLRKGEKGLEIRLDPPELGRLSVSVSMDSESFTLQIMASSPTTRDLLLGQAERLRQAFIDQDVNLSALSVDVQSGKKDAQQHSSANMNPSETLILADWESDKQNDLSGAKLFHSVGGRLLDYFV